MNKLITLITLLAAFALNASAQGNASPETMLYLETKQQLYKLRVQGQTPPLHYRPASVELTKADKKDAVAHLSKGWTPRFVAKAMVWAGESRLQEIKSTWEEPEEYMTWEECEAKVKQIQAVEHIIEENYGKLTRERRKELEKMISEFSQQWRMHAAVGQLNRVNQLLHHATADGRPTKFQGVDYDEVNEAIKILGHHAWANLHVSAEDWRVAKYWEKTRAKLAEFDGEETDDKDLYDYALNPYGW